MSQYRLLVVDVDGTLVGRGGDISAEDMEALAGLRRSGVLVSLSTGRVPEACRRIISQLSLDGYHIFFDGALVSNHDQSSEVYVSPLEEGLIKEAVDFAHSSGMDLELYTASRYFIERETEASEIRRRFFDLEPKVVDFDGLWEKERIIKAELTTFSPQEEAEVRKFSREFEHRLRFSWAQTPAYPGIFFINVTSPGVSKGRALEALASHLEVDLAQVVAIGDGINDVPLFSAAGLAIAMQNASEEVRAVADYVTGNVNDNGVARAIDRYLR